MDLKMVGEAGLEPAIDVISRTNYVSTAYKTASLLSYQMSKGTNGASYPSCTGVNYLGRIAHNCSAKLALSRHV